MRDKTEIRSWARSLPPPTEEEQRAVVAGLETHLAGLDAVTVLVYRSMSGELEADRVVAPGSPHRFVTTRTPSDGWLTVHPFDAPLERHRFGFEQPAAWAEEVPVSSVDLVLAPGLSFDPEGRRLGWGRGYYDELLGRLRPDAVAIGVTLERRIVDRLPEEPHDVRMRLLATEQGVRPVL